MAKHTTIKNGNPFLKKSIYFSFVKENLI